MGRGLFGSCIAITLVVAVFLGVSDPAYARADFEPAVTYSGVTQAQSVVSADFDKDGDRDLTVGSRAGSNNVSLLRNNGNGAFATPTAVAAGAAQITLATADFNGDGNADLALRPSTASSVRVLLGNGNGTFGSAIVLTIGGGTSNVNSQSITTGDFDGNGRIDLAAALNGSTNNVSVLYNNSCGVPTCAAAGFSRTDFTAGAGPFAITGGDLNGDGRDDLAVANGTSAANVLLSTGPGFATAVSYPNTGTALRSILARDLDGDGDRDLVIANQGTASNVYVLLNNGSGVFGAATSYTSGSGTRYVVAGDFDRDGRVDLGVVRATSPGSVAILLGDGSGAFTKQTEEFPVGNEPLSLVTADFDADGLLDLASANFQSSSVSVLLNETTLSDLSIGKTGPATATFGQPFDYTVTVTNNGPDAAESVAITDDLPAGVGFNSASFNKSSPAGSGACPQASGRVTCNVGTLNSGGTATATINVTPTATGDLTNTASYTSAADTDPGPRSVTITTPVVAADLSVSKSDSPDPVAFGENVTYTVTVSNAAGAAPATDVRVTDPIPGNTTLVSASSSQGSCPPPPDPGDTSGTVTCDLGTVAADDSATVTIMVKPTAQAVTAGSVTNRATVSSPTDPTDSSDSVTTAVNAANLTIDKQGSPDPILAGQILTYTIAVGNDGTATATGTSVIDPLPANTEFVSVTSSQGDCPSPPTPNPGDTSGTVRCNLGDVGVGETATVTLEVRPTAEAAESGAVSNRATARSPNDPRPGADRDSTAVVNRAADLSMEKSADPDGSPGDPALAGQPLTYTLTVSNGGPNAARNTTVTDELPDRAGFVSVRTDTGSCPTRPPPGEAGGTLECELGTLANGATATITVVVRPGAAAAGLTLSNTASAESDTADTDPDNNTATVETPVTAAADLSIGKSADPDGSPGNPALAGQTLTYTLTVSNDGPNAARNTTITDDLPENTAFVSASPGCVETDGTVTCDLGSVSVGERARVAIEVRPTADAAGTSVRNEARVGSDTADPNPDNDTASVSTPITAAADLSIGKSADPDGSPADPALAGQPLTYTLDVTNDGPNTATNTTVTDELPADVVFVSAGPGCAETGGTLTCDLGNLAAGASATVTIEVRPTATAAGTSIRNEARVQSDTADPDPGNDTASVRTPIVASADLSIGKSADPDGSPGDPALAGQPLTYTLDVTNDGPNAARNATVTDELPADVVFVSADAGCAEAGGVVTCDLGNLAVGASETVTIEVRPTADAAGTSIRNEATVSSDAADPDPDNNTTTVSTPITAAADLAIRKSAAPDPARVGRDLTYTLTVTNGGPNAATGVTATDELPAETGFVSASTDTGSCPEQPGPGQAGGTVGCDLGALAVDATATVTIVVRPGVAAANGDVENTASTQSDVPDPDPENNTTTISTPVSPAADLSIQKSDNTDSPVPVGQLLTYTVTVDNGGPNTAEGVRVTDTLPADVAFVSASPECSEAEGTVSCDLGNLSVGDPATVTIRVRPTAAAAGTSVRNEARVESSTTDSDPDNDTAAVETQIVASADLSIRKVGAPDPVRVGQDLTYTLTASNGGPNAATGVTLVDELPETAEFVSVEPASGSCTAPELGAAGGTVTCDLGTFADGGSVEIVVVVRPQDGAARITNTANVGGDQFDPNTANNSASDETEVTAGADLSIVKRAPATVPERDAFTYTLTVTNGGPSSATDVSVRDVLPAGVVFVSASSGCQHGGGVVTCTRASLPASGQNTVTYRIQVRADTQGTKTNTATVDSPTFDPNRDNNSSSARTRVTEPSCTIAGTNGNELLRGTNGDDVICARNGNDIVYALAGNDIVRGGGGGDKLYGDTGRDLLQGDSGNDALSGSTGDDLLVGGTNNDVLRGEAGNDQLDSRDGVERNDTNNGGPGTNTCRRDRGDRATDCS